MITVQEHLCRIVDTVMRLSPTGLDLLDAQGCVLARDVTSEVDLPGFTNSAMGGYAVYAADVKAASATSPVTLPVVHDIAAGDLVMSRGTRLVTAKSGGRSGDWVEP